MLFPDVHGHAAVVKDGEREDRQRLFLLAEILSKGLHALRLKLELILNRAPP